MHKNKKIKNFGMKSNYNSVSNAIINFKRAVWFNKNYIFLKPNSLILILWFSPFHPTNFQLTFKTCRILGNPPTTTDILITQTATVQIFLSSRTIVRLSVLNTNQQKHDFILLYLHLNVPQLKQKKSKSVTILQQ